tara:strand:+ start:496 stop:1365 length:870 start_codon:yes stop_codon:yes gene_type:complete
MSIPILVIHFGNQLYVKKCLEETVKHNPNNVYLIGDESNLQMCQSIGVHHVLSTTLPIFQKFQLFCDHFQNYSSNPKQFELVCFLRWFYTLAFMNFTHIDKVVHLDSDAILLCNSSVFDEIQTGTSNPAYDALNPLRMSNCNHTSVLSRDYVTKFVDLCIDIYVTGDKYNLIKEKVEYHKTHPGGICDMTITYLLNQMEQVTNLLKPNQHGYVIMNTINVAEGDLSKHQYEFSNKYIVIYKCNKNYYLYDTIRKQYSRLTNIHFQGAAKQLIQMYDIDNLPCIVHKTHL